MRKHKALRQHDRLHFFEARISLKMPAIDHIEEQTLIEVSRLQREGMHHAPHINTELSN